MPVRLTMRALQWSEPLSWITREAGDSNSECVDVNGRGVPKKNSVTNCSLNIYHVAIDRIFAFQYMYFIKKGILPCLMLLFRGQLWMLLHLSALTQLCLVPHICVSESGHHWFRWCLITYSAPSHYLNQCWVIVNWSLMSKLQFLIKIQNISFTKMHLTMSYVKCQPFCPGGDELTDLKLLSPASHVI